MSISYYETDFEDFHERHPRKKPNIFCRILRGIVTCVAAVLSTCITVQLLSCILLGSGTSSGSATPSSADLAVMDRYDMYMTNRVSDALDGVVTIERVYWLSDEDTVAPKPNPDCAGQTTDPTSLQWLLDQAAEELGVTDTLFSTDVKLMPGTSIQYYIDSTIMVITWKQLIHDAAYTFSEVKIKHPSQFRRFVADGTYGSEKQYLTTEMAQTVNAVTASSGDFYKFRSTVGVKVYNGVVYNADDSLDVCYITEDGEMIFTRAGEIKGKEAAEQFVEDNKVRFSLAFGPILVDNGQKVTTNTYPIGEINNRYSRAGIGQLGELHYLMVTANLVTGNGKTTPTIDMFADQMLSFGCEKAYSLDGGQTAVIVTNGELINRPDYGYQRQISDIIYFATALPDGE